MGSRKLRTTASFCEACGERIIWAATQAGARQALNPLPNSHGSVMAFHDANGTWQARSTATGTERRHPLEKTYMPHTATCVPPDVEDPPEDAGPHPQEEDR